MQNEEDLGPFAKFEFEDKVPAGDIRNVWGAWAEGIQRLNTQPGGEIGALRSEMFDKWQLATQPEGRLNVIEENFDSTREIGRTNRKFVEGMAFYCQTLMRVCEIHKQLTNLGHNHLDNQELQKMRGDSRDEGGENQDFGRLLGLARLVEQGKFNKVLEDVLKMKARTQSRSFLDSMDGHNWEQGKAFASVFAGSLVEVVAGTDWKDTD